MHNRTCETEAREKAKVRTKTRMVKGKARALAPIKEQGSSKEQEASKEARAKVAEKAKAEEKGREADPHRSSTTVSVGSCSPTNNTPRGITEKKGDTEPNEKMRMPKLPLDRMK